MEISRERIVVTVNMELPDKRKRGRPQRKFVNGVKKDMEKVGVTEKDPRDRVRWRQISHSSDLK